MTIHVISKLNQATNMPIRADFIIEETADLIIIYVKD